MSEANGPETTSGTAPDELGRVAAEVRACTRCDLHVGARHGVPGIGNSHAEVLLVGEAPSAYDDRRGDPFSGPSGTFLDELLGVAGLTRADCYLTNLVKHRVPESRQIAPGELAACLPYLARQIAALRPRVVVALGRGPTEHFLPGVRVSREHGRARRAGGRIVVPMYNPAAGLHREELRQTIVDDFRTALPAALAEARRLPADAAPERSDDDGPQQLSLF